MGVGAALRASLAPPGDDNKQQHQYRALASLSSLPRIVVMAAPACWLLALCKYRLSPHLFFFSCCICVCYIFLLVPAISSPISNRVRQSSLVVRVLHHRATLSYDNNKHIVSYPGPMGKLMELFRKNNTYGRTQHSMQNCCL